MTVRKLRSLMADFERAAQQSGRSKLALLLEAVRLRASRSRLGITEYLEYRVFAPDLSFAQKKQFAGYKMQKLLEEFLVDDFTLVLGQDKLTMYRHLASLGLPVPETLAVVGRVPGGNSPLALNRFEDFAPFLRTTLSRQPVYFKPAFGAYGDQNLMITACDGDDQLTTGTGKQLPMKTFFDQLMAPTAFGWVAQTCLTSHPIIAEAVGTPKISGVRIVTFLSGTEVVHLHAFMKINASHSDSDNFQNGASGNLLANLDIKTGRITSIVSNLGVNQRTVTAPSSGDALIDRMLGFQLPFWAESLELVKSGASALPGFICPGWDVAICPDGPKILEVNYFGDVTAPQVLNRRGFVDDEFERLLAGNNMQQYLAGALPNKKRQRANGRGSWRKDHWTWAH